MKVMKGGFVQSLYPLYENEQGGLMKVYIDNNLIGTVNSLEKQNSFAWKNIGNINLTSGTHN